MNKWLAILISGDAIFAIISLYGGAALRFSLYGQKVNSFFMGEIKIITVVIYMSVLFFASHFLEIYNREKQAGKKDILVRVLLVLAISFFILSAIFYLIPLLQIGRGWLLLSLVVFAFLQFVWHVSYRLCLNFPGLINRVVILGTGQLANKIGRLIVSTNHNHLLSGYIHCSTDTSFVPTQYIIKNGNGLFETVKQEKAKKIVVSLSEKRGILPSHELLACKLSGVEVIDAPSFYEELTGKLLIENITPSCLIFSDGFRKTYFKCTVKRILDVFFAVFGLIIVAPFFPIIALLIKLEASGPVFLKQIRIGEGEKEFALYKFRTMYQDAESKTGAVWAQKKDPRITVMGKYLRKMRIDEIPQLYNVLKGEMSFVGPRPERPEFTKKLKQQIPFYSERHTVKPGITGWAQVKYSYGASLEEAIEKLKYDLFYIKHISLCFDLLIILETIKVVLFGRGGR